MEKLSRREFLIKTGAFGTALAIGWRPGQAPANRSTAVPSGRVVHVHSNLATGWDYATGWYGDHVNPVYVDEMTNRGLMALTNTTTRADAWRALIPAYNSGQKVAIKINLNNANCGDDDQIIDALPQPINPIIQGLESIGVAENDICVYDATRGWHNGEMPARLVSKITALFPDVRFDPSASGCSTADSFSTQKIQFNCPMGMTPITDRPICNTLVNAAYLINMPIMKKHGMAGVTLAFKNHFGSFDGCENVHHSVDLSDAQYVSTYNGLIDIYNNTHIKNKTVLTVGDGLLGARINNYDEVPSRWSTFGNRSPNSLFFSVDPVAIDCVMYDFLDAQDGVPTGSDDYLRLANSAGLGTFEHWDSGHQYQTIDYQRLEVNSAGYSLYLPLTLKP